MIKKYKKLLSIVLVCAMLFTLSSVVMASAPAKKNYIIDNPYDDIDWDAWDDYKTQLHCHTNASDGFLPVQQFCAQLRNRCADRPRHTKPWLE